MAFSPELQYYSPGMQLEVQVSAMGKCQPTPRSTAPNLLPVEGKLAGSKGNELAYTIRCCNVQQLCFAEALLQRYALWRKMCLQQGSQMWKQMYEA
jgi:hypothetical protein